MTKRNDQSILELLQFDRYHKVTNSKLHFTMNKLFPLLNSLGFITNPCSDCCLTLLDIYLPWEWRPYPFFWLLNLTPHSCWPLSDHPLLDPSQKPASNPCHYRAFSLSGHLKYILKQTPCQ